MRKCKFLVEDFTRHDYITLNFSIVYNTFRTFLPFKSNIFLSRRREKDNYIITTYLSVLLSEVNERIMSIWQGYIGN